MIFKTRCVVTQRMPQQAAKIKIQTFVYFQKKLYILESILINFLKFKRHNCVNKSLDWKQILEISEMRKLILIKGYLMLHSQ